MVKTKLLKKIAWKNGLIHYFNVWENSILIGTGYCISRDELIGQPELFTLTGERLPEGWYQLQMTEFKPCIIPKNVQ